MTVALQSRFAEAVPEMAVRWQAENFPTPTLLAFNDDLAVELGLDADWLRSEEGARFLVGNAVPADAAPVAQAYAGHQFGGFVPRLGDGRALLLGEVLTAAGDVRDLHLKGSGATPFARGGDGLAAVGPMLREYIVGEAMHALGIPTTRALAVLGTGRPVYRETALPGAVLVRVARSHLRVGSFQYAAGAGPDLVRRLADHAIARHYPDAAAAANPYLALLDAVVAAQAVLVADWMLVGFIHGVMNTDNMTISGETIDYGPCAFMDAYDPATVFSSIDTAGRYAYGNQPAMAHWNLTRFAETLLPLLDDEQDAAVSTALGALEAFQTHYSTAMVAGFRTKIGLPERISDDVAVPLITDLLDSLHTNRVDFTSFFRALAAAGRGEPEPARGLFADLAGFDAWLHRWQALDPQAAVMDRTNPIYIPRNHLVEEALAAATGGDVAPMAELLTALRDPYTARADLARYAEPAPADFGTYRTFCGT